MSAHPSNSLRIGISVGGGPAELARSGFTIAAMNRFIVRLSRALLAEGETLAFGHDWRQEGVMEAIASVALDQSRSPGGGGEGVKILNLLPWPGKSSATDPELLARLKGIVDVRPTGLPRELAKLEEKAIDEGPDSDHHKFLRARGLTHLRFELTRCTQARFAAGGKRVGYQGRIPGIAAEVLLALEAGQPVYLAGLLGGAARELGRIIIDKQDPQTLWKDLPLEGLYRAIGAPSNHPLEAPELDLEALGTSLHSGVLARSLFDNGLSEEENLRLFRSTLEEEVIALVLTGLWRVKRQGLARGSEANSEDR